MLAKIKGFIRPIYYRYEYWVIRILYAFKRNKVTDPQSIPIIINNFNRLTSLKLLIEALESRGYSQLYIIDNNSTYPPLLEFYQYQCKYKVYRLKENLGYLALWKSGIYKSFFSDFFVYTDSDVVPIKECPTDFLKLFHNELLNNPVVDKVGFSLKIDDLPDHFAHKAKVIQWEKQYFEKKVNDQFYRANIDTTFALYRPRVKHGANIFLTMYRASYPYQARHLPWYVNSSNPDEEEQYYLSQSKTSTHWTGISNTSK